MAITMDSIQLGMDATELASSPAPPQPQPQPTTTQSQRVQSTTAPPTEEEDGTEELITEILRTPFGSFSVGKRIGRGAFAMVYKARWNETGHYVAVKKFDTSQMTTETVDSVLMEVNLLGRLKHPNILRILGYHRQEENLYLMLEFAENGSLLKLVKELGSLPEHLVCMYVEQVVKALVYLHTAGVIHRDIKAANILLTKAGNVKLADFGVAAVMGEVDKHFTIVGSPYWMAPEVISATGHSLQSDVWSLACTIIELLTGEPPYFGLNPMTAMFKIVQNPAPIPGNCSAPLRDLLSQCFEKDPSKRPTAEMLQKHPWFVHGYTASMEISAVRQHVQQYQQQHRDDASVTVGGSSSTTSPTSAPGHARGVSVSARMAGAPLSMPGAGCGGRPYATRERRDSKASIPEHVLERLEKPIAVTASGLSVAGVLVGVNAAATPNDEDDSSESESSHGLRDSAKYSGSSRDGDASVPLSPVTGRKQQLSSSSARTAPALSASPMHMRLASAPQAVLQGLTAPAAKSAPLSPPAASAREEEMAREIEDLKRRLMQVESQKDPMGGGAAAVKSVKAQYIRELQPTVVDVPPSSMRICSISEIAGSLWVGGADGTVTIYRLPAPGQQQPSTMQLQAHTSFKLHKSRIYSMVAVGSSKVWCSSEEGEIYVVPIRSPSDAKRFMVHDTEHRMIKALGHVPGAHVRVWSCAPSLSNSQIVVLTKHCVIKYKLTIKHAINCITLSPSRETVWLGCFGAIIVCDAVRGDLRREIKLPDAAQTKKVTQLVPVGDLVWCAAGKQILVLDPYQFRVERVLQQPCDVERLASCENIVFAGDSAAQVECYDPVLMTRVHTLVCPIAGGDGQPAPVKALVATGITGRTCPTLFVGSIASGKLCVWSQKPPSTNP